MFIQTETTPNPATLKFLPGRTVLPRGPSICRTGRLPPNRRSPSGCSDRGRDRRVLRSDFITVTKSDTEWQQLKPAILGAIMEHFMSGGPLLRGEATGGTEAEEFFEQADAETVATIKDLIETRVRPAVANDGGDITFRGYKDGVVYLDMQGSCSGCPSSTATLKHGIQNLLRHYVPEVVEVRPM
jgi:Fe-S cluster biogenesis protein NfuA